MENKITSPKVLFFDVNETLLDLTPIKTKITKLFNGDSDKVSHWFSTLLHYSLVVSATGDYHHFGKIGAVTLKMLAAEQGISLSLKDAKLIVTQGFKQLPAHEEVANALSRLKRSGYTLVALTNSDSDTLAAQLQYAQLASFFDAQLSVEKIGLFKPHSKVYGWAALQMGVDPKDTLLLAAHGWDVAGALQANLRAIFIARKGKYEFPLAPKTEAVVQNLTEAADYLIGLK